MALAATMLWGATPELLPELSVMEWELLPVMLPPDSTGGDTSKAKLPYPIRDRKPWERQPGRNPLDLGEPSAIKNSYELDPQTNSYNYSSKIGSQEYRMPATLNMKQQMAEENKRQNSAYFRQRAQANNYTSGTGLIPPLKIGPKVFERIFGSGVIDIRPRGTAELIFQGLFNTVRNPALPPQQQTTGQFDFRQKIQVNVQGSIGDRMKVNINYDTEATFDFENQIKLDYGGKEDDIIKKIEVGNVSLPLNSQLIQGSQSLFGVKTEMQFGRLKVTSIFTQQRGQTTETEITGGAQTTRFNIQADNYDVNRHFFLAHYFRDNYDNWLANLPIIGSPVVIGRVEVWITNRTGNFEGSRDVGGFADLGEASRRDNKNWQLSPNRADTFPDNGTSELYFYLTGRTPINRDTAALRSSLNLQNQLLRDQPVTRLQPISQYQVLSYARLLNPSEYTVNRQLGYISLNQTLNNDDILCVAFEYSLNGRNYRVGEFSTDIPQNPQTPNVLFAKMLKGPSLRPDLPMWDLMMKNVYSLGAFGIQQKDFRFNIVYADDPSGADLNYIPAPNEPLLTGQPLIQVLNLDNMNTVQERAPDGLFDFIEGITVNTQQGRIIFPTVEPFGENLRKKFITNPQLARYYCFFELYDSTRFAAIQLPQYNKFFIRGSYQGQSNTEISLNGTNIPRGSVRVTANGAPLTENIDYTVDYNLGRVKILNTGLLNSGAVIKVSSESNSLFSVQQKTLLGTRLDYKVNRDFMLGSSILYLNERPLTPKVNLGEEPISNLIVGIDGSYKKESRFLTKLVDRLPFYETKDISTITLSGEYAHLFPGIQGALAQNGTAYLDDFEGAETQFDIRAANNWVLASVPQGQPDLFPEGNLVNDLQYGYKRSLLNWYQIANTFHLPNTLTPQHIRDDQEMLSDHRMRLIRVEEVFPNRQIQRGMPDNLTSFDLAFYPKERGPYNYNPAELNADGTFVNPKSQWGGVMRRIENPDFEAANIDYIEIWMMDPARTRTTAENPGQLYINLGNISEDVLRDNRRAAENGLPRNNDPNQQFVDTSVWGRVPRAPVVNFAFDADPAVRITQDVGLDGYDDPAERTLFDTAYLQKLSAVHPPGTPAFDQALEDPSKDNYHYYLGTDYDNQQLNILERYKKFNGHQGNSPTQDQSPETYPTTATNVPDMEDINRDYTLNDMEEYFQYRIDLSPDKMVLGQNYIASIETRNVKLQNGKNDTITWYQFKIPIREYERKVGQIYDFRSMRFIRMFMRGFENDQVLRMGSLQFVRADWRKYLNSLEDGKEGKPTDDADQTQFVISTVNIEKNSARSPIAYKVPPGIQREVDFSTPQAIQQNEQSLSLLVCNLLDGDARAVFKSTQVDLRQYGRLRMFLHADGNNINNGELTAFIRIGTDLTNNYYEYEMPLIISRSGATDLDVWPVENELNILLEDFIDTKIARNNANHPFTARFSRALGRGKMSVIGLPDLSNLRVMMLGVRNPKATPGSADDGAPKCAEVWFNELRMTEFNNRGGWAAVGTMQAKLADLGQVQAAGSISSVGWGGIDKKIQQRQLDDRYQYDLSGSFELGRFFPKTSGISIPVFVSYGNTLIRPFYNPLNPDTRLQKELDQTIDENRRERISNAADDYTARRSMNFTNVRKNRINTQRNNPWDIENFSFTYNFNEVFRRNQEIAYYVLQNYQTMVNYTYTFRSKPWEPFKKIKSKQLTLIKDFNVYFLPQSWGARVQTDRRYGVNIFRSNDLGTSSIPALYDKMYSMTRYYEFAYNFSRGLTFNYNATALARIDEPLGRIDETTPEKRDTLWRNLLNGGRIMQFDQSARMNYNVPLNKIQQLNFISQSSYTYQATYQWKQAPPAADSLGNTISNSRMQQYNLNLNMSLLYNKFKLLKDLNAPPAQKKQSDRNDQEGIANDKGKGKDDKGKKKKEEEETKKINPVLAATLRLITSLKNMNFSYTQNDGSTLPGFKFKPEYVGNNFTNTAPGIDFILGGQDPDLRFRAARNGWLSSDPRLASMYMSEYREQLTGRATLEPLQDFRIDLNVSKQRSLQRSVIFRYNDSIGDFADLNDPIENGSYTITYNVWRTSFNSDDAFKQLQENRILIAQRLALDPEKPGRGIDTAGFPIGYGRSSQDVLIPAFLAAYGGTDANKIGLTSFPTLPDINWKIAYNGLSKIEWVKQFANNIQISNQYTSTYTVSGFQNILQDSTNLNGFTGDYVSKYQIRQVQIAERWGPFIGLDITFVNNINAKFEYKRDRAINFGLTNGQISEMSGNEFSFSTGYRTSKLEIPFLSRSGRRLVLESDINFKLDFSIQQRVTSIRYLDRETTDPVQGQTIYQLRPNIDYMISEQLMLRIFYDYRRTDPATSNTFPTIIQSGGFSLRYTLQ